MVTLDSSIIPALVIFLVLICALNYLLFRPLQRIQDERESRTTGLMSQTRKRLDHHEVLFSQYQTAIKQGRLESYRYLEQVRSEAMQKRTELMEQARKKAEGSIEEARQSIRNEVQAAKTQLETEAREIARGIVGAILQRQA